MKERKAKVLEIILRTICIVSVVFIFICESIQPMLICFICYFLYRAIGEIVIFTKRIRYKKLYKTVDTILLSERVICYIVLTAVLLYYFLK